MDDAEMHWEDSFRTLAGQQEGAIGRDQVADLGYSYEHWRRAAGNGRWHRLTNRVLLLEGSPASPGRRVHAALLDAGGDAVLHGPSALAWYGLRGYDLRSLHVARSRLTRNAASCLAVTHRLRDLGSDERRIVRGVPVVAPIRAIWSEASRFSDPRWFEPGLARVGRLLDEAHRLGLLDWSDLHRSLDAHGRRGRAGTRLLRSLAEDRLPGSSPTESRLEDRFEEVLARAGIPPMIRQVLVGGQRAIGRVDHRHPELPLVAEVNSFRFHTTPTDQAADECRYEALRRAGFTVVVVWEDDLWSRPTNVVTAVRHAEARARSGNHTVVHTAGCPWPTDPTRLVIAPFLPDHRG